MKLNVELRQYAKEKNVYLWQIAKRMNLSEASITRKLRDELDEREKSEIMAIIDGIASKKENLC